MKAKHAAQIRRGIRFAKNKQWVWTQRQRINLYRAFIGRCTALEWRAYDQYRQRHWTD